MKTVQEWLKEVNEKDLIDTYIFRHPIDYTMIPDKELTLAYIQEFAKKNLAEFLQRMKTIDVRRDNEMTVFFAYDGYRDGRGEVITSMCKVEELLAVEHPDSYAWDLSSFSDVMGYYIVETETTMDNILDVLSDIIDELTFFGYDEIEKDRVKDELLQTTEEIKSGKYAEAKSYSLDDLRKELGLKPRKKDKKRDELKYNIHAAENEFNLYQRGEEIKEVVKLLKGQK